MSTPTIAQIDKNPYLGRTATTPRPSAADTGGVAYPETLARHQLLWDEARQWAEGNDQLRVDRTAKLDADREAEATRRQREARADLEAGLRRDFLLNPAATENDWAAVKDQLVREALMASNPVAEARAEILRSGRYGVL